jgi:type I restriction enzyme S subunit
MKADELRKSILQLAIQGKLVKQDPDDEPASVLIEKIRMEKQQLVKEGKIKKDKTESFIYKAADNSYYEKIGNETRCIDEEIPFEVPEGWEFCRLNFVCWLGDGEKLTGEPLPYLEAKYLRGKSDATILNSGKVVNPNSKVILVDGENSGEVFDITERGYIGSTFKTMNIATNIYERYIQIILEFYKNLFRDSKVGAAIPHLNKKLFHNLIIAIPPYSEQKRILDRLDTLTPMLLKYFAFEIQESQLTDTFPDALKKSILQYAIQGKLVAQNPNDEPASVLLEKICKEKKQLIKSGKLKRDKTESFIYKDTSDNSYYEKIGNGTCCIDEEIPFEIPENWEWVRLKNILQINPTNKADDNINASFVTMKDIEAGYSNSFKFEKKEWGKIKKGFTHFQNGDVAFAKITPCFQNRKSLIFNGLINNIGAGTTELHILRPISGYINPFYLLIFVKTEFFIQYGINNFTGTAGQQRFPTDKLKEIFIPLPPNKEQQRITEKIKQIFTVIV